MSNIQTRLEKLERAAHRWRIVACCLALPMLAAFFMGQTRPSPKPGQAEKFEFYDKDGRLRMVVGKLDGDFGLWLIRPGGSSAGHFRMSDTTPAMGTSIVIREPKEIGRANKLASLELTLQSMEETRKSATEESRASIAGMMAELKREMQDEAAHMGDRDLWLDASEVRLQEKGQNMRTTHVGVDGIATTSITVGKPGLASALGLAEAG